MGFTRAELESFRDATVPDLVGPGLRLLFVGINPGLWTAATSTHFAHPGNRFYPALLRAGVIDRPIDRGAGMTDDDRRALIERGIGITNLVARATPRASELSVAELREGAVRLAAFVAKHRPAVVAVAGVTAYRVAFDRPKARARTPARDAGGRRAVGRPQPERPQRPRDDRHPRHRLPRPGRRRRTAEYVMLACPTARTRTAGRTRLDQREA